MKDLWKQARKYGKVRLGTTDNGTYFAALEFNTPKHTTIKVGTSFDHAEPEHALGELILNAQEAVQLALSLEAPK